MIIEWEREWILKDEKNAKKAKHYSGEILPTKNVIANILVRKS